MIHFYHTECLQSWGETKRIESFFDEIEKTAIDLPLHARTTIQERIQLARDMIGKTDALQKLSNWQTPQEILDSKKNRSSNVMDLI